MGGLQINHHIFPVCFLCSLLHILYFLSALSIFLHSVQETISPHNRSILHIAAISCIRTPAFIDWTGKTAALLIDWTCKIECVCKIDCEVSAQEFLQCQSSPADGRHYHLPYLFCVVSVDQSVRFGGLRRHGGVRTSGRIMVEKARWWMLGDSLLVDTSYDGWISGATV